MGSAKTYIHAPPSALYLEDFFRQHPVEDITALVFYKFWKFRSSQRQGASADYKKHIYDRARACCGHKVTANMTADWRYGREEREAYWKELQAAEEQQKLLEEKKKLLQQHVRRIEVEVIERSDIVGAVLTKEIRANAQAAVAPLQTTEKQKPEEEKEEIVEDKEEQEEVKDGEGDGYTTNDLYDPDDLSHLLQLGAQADHDQVSAESSDADGEDNAPNAVDDRENPQCSRKKRRTARCRTFDAKSKAAFRKRYMTLGRKWELSSSGKFVEDVIYKIGRACEYYHPVHSFMIDCDDEWLASHFTTEEWSEICDDWPEVSISAAVASYIESFADVDTLEELKTSLSVRPDGQEEQLVHRCLEDWHDIYSDDPSPFLIAERLSEAYWQLEAWGVTHKLAKGCPNCKMLPGDVAGVESKERQNRVQASKGPHLTRARIGKKGDIFWRSFDEPQRDWAVVEAAKAWNTYKDKYAIESTAKLPRQLHDILIHRTRELASVERLRATAIAGLVMGGPVVQLLTLCWGRGGVNITRFKRGEATRLESSVDMLGMSLSAVYTLLTFRATTLHVIKTFHSERKKIQRKARLRRVGLKSAEPNTEDEEELPLNLLSSSP